MLKILPIIVFLFCSSLVYSQEKPKDTTASAKKTKRFDLTIMPYLSYNRNLDFMFGAIPMAMYRTKQEDTISPKSLSGLTAIYTTNKSYFVSFFNKLYFKEDSWRVQFYFLTGNLNSQFFMDDIDTPDFYDYGTKMTRVSVGVDRKIIPHLYGGISYSYSHYNTVYEDDVQPQSVSHTNALIYSLLYDTRNAIYYPTHGEKVKLRWASFPEWFGNDISANKILTEYNKYFSLRNGKDVLAARFAGTFGIGNIGFEQQVHIGGKDIRGYSEGKYRGDGTMALQTEYRYNFNEKMGVVGFAGLATLYGSDTENFNWKAYPGAGVGYRYKAFKSVKFNIGLDAAVGKDDWGVYFRIGEAF